jgi:multidrug resistance efflux pump
MTEVIHESSSRRRYFRLTAPIRVKYNGKEYLTENWSLGGFKIHEIDFIPEKDAVLEFTLGIPFQDYVLSAEQRARVVMYNPEEKSLACEFIEMNIRTSEMLKYFSDCLISGEMASIDHIIRHIDIPVTPPPMVDVRPWRDQPFKVKLARVMMMLFYLFLGASIITYALTTVYSHVFRVHVDTAVVSILREEVVSPVNGVIERVYLPVGESFSKGQPLLEIKNREMLKMHERAEIELERAKKNLAFEQSNLSALEKKIVLYKNITAARIGSLTHKVTGLTKELELAEKDYKRQFGLADINAISRSKAEQAESTMVELKRTLEATQEDLNIQRHTMEALNNGLFFSGIKVEQNRDDLVSRIKAAATEVKLKETELESIKRNYSHEIIRAPFDGKLLRVVKSEGNLIKTGEPVLFIEKNGKLEIVAFLTQREVSRVSDREEAVVYVPSEERHYKAKVTSIDRTSGFENPGDVDFRWRSSSDRSAVVKLELIGSAQKDHGLRPGLPVTVNFKSSTSDNSVGRFIRKYILREDIDI